MLALILQIIVSLIFAAMIGFACAWFLQRHSVQSARKECSDTRQRLEKITLELHAFRTKERAVGAHEFRLGECEAELRILEDELESMLDTLAETRRDIPVTSTD